MPSEETATVTKPTKDDIKSHPEFFAQPKTKIDYLTRQEYIDDDFMKLYGNPTKGYTKHDKYIDKPKDVQSKIKSWDEVNDSMADEIVRERQKEQIELMFYAVRRRVKGLVVFHELRKNIVYIPRTNFSNNLHYATEFPNARIIKVEYQPWMGQVCGFSNGQ